MFCKMENRIFKNYNGQDYEIIAQYKDICLVKDVKYDHYIVATTLRIEDTTKICSWGQGHYFNEDFNASFLCFIKKILNNFVNFSNEGENESYETVSKYLDILNEIEEKNS